MKSIAFFTLLLLLYFLKCDCIFGFANLETQFSQDYILETKKIDIPGFPFAFNPSIINCENGYLMSFRVIPDPKFSFLSWIGIVRLDTQFNPIDKPQLLNLREYYLLIPSRAEDARLISIQGKIYLIYSDNIDEKISKGGFRIFLAELAEQEGHFIAKSPECLSCFEGESKKRREKNWVPFEYENQLLLAYSLLPHKIFLPLLGSGSCMTIDMSVSPINWEWGELRGGTPALQIENQYLAFFHSSKKMASIHSQGKEILHYFVGAYTFSLHPPFVITKISPQPIVSEGFYSGQTYKPFWKEVKVIFPCGQIIDKDFIWLTYGREDHEIWIAKIDKNKLLNSLISL